MRRPPVLSVYRPWTTFLLNGWKDPENRCWSTTYRGDLLIAGALRYDRQAFPFARRLAALAGMDIPLGEVCDDPQAHPTGILGVVELYDICTYAYENPGAVCSCPWWAIPGQMHWRIRNPRPFTEPVPCGGSQRLWKVPDRVWPQVETQLQVAGCAA